MTYYADELYRLGKHLDEQMARVRQRHTLSDASFSFDYDALTASPDSFPDLSESELKFVFAEAARRGDIAILQAAEIAWNRRLYTAGLSGAVAGGDPEIIRWLVEGGSAISPSVLHDLASRGDAETLELILTSRKFPASEILLLLDTPDETSGLTAEALASDFRTRDVLRGRRILALASEAQDRYKNGLYDEAENFYASALDLCGTEDPNRAKLMYNLARALYRQGRYVRAVQCCTDSLALDGTYLNSYRCRAHSYIGLLDFDRALADLEVCGEDFRLQRVFKSLNAFAVLGINNSETSESEVRAAFREKARKFHPDKNSGASDEVRARCANFFPKIQEAYETLMDPGRRLKFSEGSRELGNFFESPDDGQWTPETLLEGTKENFSKFYFRDFRPGRMSVGGDEF